MSISFPMFMPLFGGIALALAGCPGDDTTASDSSTTEGQTSSGTTTSDPTGTEPPGTTELPGTTETPSTTSAESTGPGDTTAAETTAGGATQVLMETSLGNIVIELDEEAAPITSANFLTYVGTGFYDGTDGMGATTFHRVIPGFVIQGGGLTEALVTKGTMAPITNESGNGLLNLRGTLSMARTNDPDSATSQFFVNLVDNAFLDEPPGYAVFAEVIEGMDVVDAIAAVETADMAPFTDVPVVPVIILSVTVQ